MGFRAAAVALLVCACASAQPYVWVGQYRPGAPVARAISAGDHVQVAVLNQDPMSGDFEVRPGGEILLPVLGKIEAAGRTADELAATITARLRGLVNDPRVTVVVSSRHVSNVSVLGEVRTPGRYDIRDGDGVLDALARAGGLTEFADGDSIFVIRRGMPAPRIRFRYRDLTAADKVSTGFVLQDTDVVVVE